MKFYIADAFTEELFGGNPAGIVILPAGKKADSDEGWPAKELMVKTAAELRYSETAFVMPLSDGTFRTRYFTPADEVDLCGHATIATFTVLKKAGLLGGGNANPDGSHSYINHTMAGDLEIRVSDTSVLMEMGAPAIKGEIADEAALRELYHVMGLEEFEPHIKGSNLKSVEAATNGSAGGQPVHLSEKTCPKMVSTGLLDIMMPVKDLAALNAISPDFPALTELSRKYGVVGVHAFCSADEGFTLHARNFAPLYEIDEEAATGTSNGALTYYMKSVGGIGEVAELRIVQGEKMGRPSVIRTRIDGERIMVGGTAVVLAEGEINL